MTEYYVQYRLKAVPKREGLPEYEDNGKITAMFCDTPEDALQWFYSSNYSMLFNDFELEDDGHSLDDFEIVLVDAKAVILPDGEILEEDKEAFENM